MKYNIIYKIKTFFNRLKFRIKHPEVNLDDLKYAVYIQKKIEDLDLSDLSFVDYLEDSFNA